MISDVGVLVFSLRSRTRLCWDFICFLCWWPWGVGSSWCEVSVLQFAKQRLTAHASAGSCWATVIRQPPPVSWQGEVGLLLQTIRTRWQTTGGRELKAAGEILNLQLLSGEDFCCRRSGRWRPAATAAANGGNYSLPWNRLLCSMTTVGAVILKTVHRSYWQQPTVTVTSNRTLGCIAIGGLSVEATGVASTSSASGSNDWNVTPCRSKLSGGSISNGFTEKRPKMQTVWNDVSAC